jgi:hypothetical protein
LDGRDIDRKFEIPVERGGGEGLQQDCFGERTDETGSFRKRYEVVRTHYPANGMQPPRQDLKTTHNPASHLHQRLEVWDYFSVVESAAELSFCRMHGHQGILRRSYSHA